MQLLDLLRISTSPWNRGQSFASGILDRRKILTLPHWTGKNRWGKKPLSHKLGGGGREANKLITNVESLIPNPTEKDEQWETQSPVYVFYMPKPGD